MKVLVTFPVSKEFQKIGNKILGKENIVWYPNLENCEILLIRDNNFPYDSNVKFIQTITAGVDHINFSRIQPKTLVSSNAGAYSVSVAEHAMGLLLSAAKKIISKDSEMKSGIFKPEETILLRGKVLLIIGYGGIGSEFAKLAKTFGLKVISIARSYRDSYSDEYHSLNEIKELIPRSDFILISIPLNKSTLEMIDEDILNLSKERAIWINVARPEIVNKDHFLKFLEKRKDVYYASDVWWDEPNVHVPPLSNLILTPHIAGGRSGEIMEEAYREAFENILRFIKGEKPRNVVKLEETVWIDRGSLGV